MERPIYDTLILSDLHLGSEVSLARDAKRMLKQHRFRRLILLGDIFCDLNFRRLTKEHWQFLGYIRKLANPKRNVEVVWVEGNHDHGLTNVMSHLVGVTVYQEYGWEFAGHHHLAIHGHQFDRAVFNDAFIGRFNTFLHLLLQKVDFRGRHVSRLADRLGTRWLRLTEKVSAGALARARAAGADRVFCGHTHVAMQVEEDGISYYNTGCWVDDRPSYITIGDEGVQIHEYDDGFDDRDSGEERGGYDSPAAEFADEAGLLEDVEYEGISR
ncbi:MAG TPA: metallophosphoesterase family protein [Terriglobales bacterium]|jgi:UDP-2,3-diacylglucosamine pyrophosphatase LpxH